MSDGFIVAGKDKLLLDVKSVGFVVKSSPLIFEAYSTVCVEGSLGSKKNEADKGKLI